MDEAKEREFPLLKSSNSYQYLRATWMSFYDTCRKSLRSDFYGETSDRQQDGMDAEEQLAEVFKAVAPLYKKKRDKIYKEVTGLLQEKGITYVEMSSMTPVGRRYAEDYFTSYIQPILSPQIINAHHPFPHLINKALYIVLLLKIKEKTAYGIVPVPTTLERVVHVPGDNTRYTLLEDLVCEYVDRVFDNCTIEAKSIITVTRNADVNVGSLVDDDDDFRHQMKKSPEKNDRDLPL